MNDDKQKKLDELRKRIDAMELIPTLSFIRPETRLHPTGWNDIRAMKDHALDSEAIQYIVKWHTSTLKSDNDTGASSDD